MEKEFCLFDQAVFITMVTLTEISIGTALLELSPTHPLSSQDRIESKDTFLSHPEYLFYMQPYPFCYNNIALWRCHI